MKIDPNDPGVQTNLAIKRIDRLMKLAAEQAKDDGGSPGNAVMDLLCAAALLSKLHGSRNALETIMRGAPSACDFADKCRFASSKDSP